MFYFSECSQSNASKLLCMDLKKLSRIKEEVQRY